MHTSNHQTNTEKPVGQCPTQATQADLVIAKFGSACKLAKLLSAHLGKTIADSTVYRWTYRKEDGGTGGLIPGGALRNVLAVAAKCTPPIVITREDLYP